MLSSPTPVTVSMESLLLSIVIALITVIGLPSLGWYLKRLIVAKDENAAKALKVWQDGSIERHNELKKSVERIENCVTIVEKKMHEKMDVEIYKKESGEKWNRINKHKHQIHCNSGQCVLETTGVIISEGE
jgi:hypothetical protein